MTDIIKAMNPMAQLATEDAALAAARVSAVGIVIGAVNQAVNGWYASTPQAAEAAAGVVERLTGQTMDAEKLAQQAQMSLMIAGAFVILQLILAFVQWRKPNSVLPILFLILVIWGLGTTCLGLVTPAFSGSQPVWLTAFTVVALLIAACTHIAGIRGASALKRFRDAQAY